MAMNTKNRGIAAALIIVLAAGFGAGFFTSRMAVEYSAENKKLNEIKGVIDDYYLFGEAPESEEDWIYSGLLSSINDNYARYFTKDEFKEFTSENQGNYVGIGGQMQEEHRTGIKTFTVIYAGGPADKAGIKSGDILLEVDGEPVDDIELSEVVSNMIKGEEGTTVVLKVLREGETLELTAQREAITIQTVSSRMLEDKTGYIRVTEFLETTAGDFISAVDALQAEGATGLVVDLRLNPGGILDSAVKMADYLIEDDILENARCFNRSSLVYTLDKSGNSVSYVSGDGHSVDLPVAVLLNSGSASASELFSAALRDSGKAVLVGSNSFGKGIVQSTVPLSDGGAVKLTVSQYYTPRGYALHGLGLEPDVEVEEPGDLESADQVINDASVDKMSADNDTKIAVNVLEEIRDGRRTLKILSGGGKIEAPEGYLEQAEAKACGSAHFDITLSEAENRLLENVEKNGFRLFRCEDDWYAGDEISKGTAEYERESDVQLLEPESGDMVHIYMGTDPADGRLHWFSAEAMPPEKGASVIAGIMKDSAFIPESEEDSLYEKLKKTGVDNGTVKIKGQGYTLEALGRDGLLSVTVTP